MEEFNPLGTTTEYVIELEEGDVLQSQDLEQIVNLAILNSNSEQVFAIHEDENRASVATNTVHGEDIPETLEILPLQETIENESGPVITEDIQVVVGTEDLVHGQQNSEKDKMLESSVGSDGSLSLNSHVACTTATTSGQRQAKVVRRKKTNERMSNEIEVCDVPHDDLVVIQPFTAKTIANSSPNWRGYNTTSMIYDYLLYEKFPPSYSQNQRQALRDLRDNYIVVDKQLYFRQKKGKNIHLLLVIHDDEADLKLKIIEDSHLNRSGSHAGINKTITQIKDYFFWHGLTEHVRMFIKSCRLCVLKQTVTKERSKFLQDNFEGTLPTDDKVNMQERMDSLINEVRNLQSKIKPYESTERIKKLKTEVTNLNTSILAHMSQLRQESNSDVAGEIISSTNMEHEDIVKELGQNCNFLGETNTSDIPALLNDGENEHLNTDLSGNREDKMMLETMLPRRKIYNNSRLIEEIIRTNEYPENLNSGQINGLAQVKTHFLMINDMLYRVFSKRGRMLYVAKVIHDDEPELKKKIMKACHVDENGRHNGMNKTNSLATEAFYWHGISIHIKLFSEHCPVCRCRRGTARKPNCYVAETSNISDICSKLSGEPKSSYHEVKGNLGLTSADYQQVRELAQEVRDLNDWLFKNPTIKEEWEAMYERCSRGPKWYDYDKTGKLEVRDSKWYNKELEKLLVENTKRAIVSKFISKVLPSKQGASYKTVAGVSVIPKVTDETIAKISIVIAPDKKQDSTLKVYKEPASNEMTLASKSITVDNTKLDDIPWQISLNHDDKDDESEEVIFENPAESFNTSKVNASKDNVSAEDDCDNEECNDNVKDLDNDDNEAVKTDSEDGNNKTIIETKNINHDEDTGMTSQHKAEDNGITSQHKAENNGMTSQQKAGDNGMTSQQKAEDNGMTNQQKAEDNRMTSQLKAMDNGMISQHNAENNRMTSQKAKYNGMTSQQKAGDNGMTSQQKAAYLKNFNLAQAAKAEVDTEEIIEDDSSADVSLDKTVVDNTPIQDVDVRRISKRLKIKHEKNEKSKAKTTLATKTTKTRSGTGLDKVNDKITEATCHAFTVEEIVDKTPPMRKSSRKRKFTPKFSGFIQSECLEALSGSTNSVIVKSRRTDKGILSGDSQNSKQINDKSEITPVKQSEERVNSLNKDVSLPKVTKPIMKSSNIHVISRRLRKRAGRRVLKNQENSCNTKTIMKASNIQIATRSLRKETNKKRLKNRGKSFKAKEGLHVGGPSTHRKFDGILMKNSNVHVVKRKIKDEQTDCKSSKKVKTNERKIVESGTVRQSARSKSKTNDNSLPEIPKYLMTKSILRPRKRQVLMTKSRFVLMKPKNAEKSDRFGNATKKGRNNTTAGVLGDKKIIGLEEKQMDSEGCSKASSSELSHQENELTLKTQNDKITVECTETRTCNAVSLKLPDDEEQDNYQHAEIGDEPKKKCLKTLRTPEKHLKYNVDYKKDSKVRKGLVEIKYKEFIGMNIGDKTCSKGDIIPRDNPDVSEPADRTLVIDTGDAVGTFSLLDKVAMTTSIERDKSKHCVNQSSDLTKGPSRSINAIIPEIIHTGHISKTNKPVFIINADNVSGEYSTSSIHKSSDNHIKIAMPNTDSLSSCKQLKDDSTDNSYDSNIDVKEATSFAKPSQGNDLHLHTSSGTGGKETSSKEYKAEKSSGQRKFDCPLCKKCFLSERAYIVHKVDLCSVDCPFCGLIFKAKDRTVLAKHVQKHKRCVNFQCKECKLLFLNSGMLNIHMRIHSDGTSVSCSECSKSFPSSYLLSAHCEKEHDIPVVYKCDTCSARFGSKDFLIELKLVDGNLSVYSCALCELNI